MMAVIRHMARRTRGAIIGWGLSLALLGFYLMQFYDTLADQAAVIEQLISRYPRELMALFGGGANLFSPQGYLSLEFFSIMPVVIGIYAVLAGSSLLAGDEEAGILDLLLAQPVSRSRLFFGRLVTVATAMAAILGIVWIAFIVGVAVSKELEISAVALLRPFIALYALLFLFQTLSLLLSMILPSRNTAAMASGLVLVGSYFINALSAFNGTLRTISGYLPMKYYQSGYAVDGLEIGWVLGMFGIGLVFALLAWLLFLRRDIRVSGEGSLRLPALFARRLK
jgi:ABC-2 type transport system permease protein